MKSNQSYHHFKIPGVWLSLLLSFVTLLVLFLCLEMSLRAYTWSTGRGFSDNPIRFISSFFTTQDWPAPHRAPDGSYIFKRGEIVKTAKAPNEIRIICFGGSTTYNTSNKEQLSYSQLLETRFSREYPDHKIRVLNAGGDALSSAHTFANFSLRILASEIDPDIITVYHNINDLSATFYGPETTPDYSNKYLHNDHLGYHHRSGVMSQFVRSSRLLRFLEYKVRQLIHRPLDAPEANYRDGQVYFERNLKNIVAIAKANDIGVVLASQAARKKLRTQEGFAAYNTAIHRIANSENIPFVDIASQLRDDEKYFLDDVHYTVDGIRAVTNLFWEPLKTVVQSRLATRESWNNSKQSPDHNSMIEAHYCTTTNCTGGL